MPKTRRKPKNHIPISRCSPIRTANRARRFRENRNPSDDGMIPTRHGRNISELATTYKPDATRDRQQAWSFIGGGAIVDGFPTAILKHLRSVYCSTPKGSPLTAQGRSGTEHTLGHNLRAVASRVASTT